MTSRRRRRRRRGGGPPRKDAAAPRGPRRTRKSGGSGGAAVSISPARRDPRKASAARPRVRTIRATAPPKTFTRIDYEYRERTREFTGPAGGRSISTSRRHRKVTWTVVGETRKRSIKHSTKDTHRTHKHESGVAHPPGAGVIAGTITTATQRARLDRMGSTTRPTRLKTGTWRHEDRYAPAWE